MHRQGYGSFGQIIDYGSFGQFTIVGEVSSNRRVAIANDVLEKFVNTFKNRLPISR